MPKPIRDNFEDLSVGEVQDMLSKEKRALSHTVVFAAHLKWEDGAPKIVGVPVRMAMSPAEKFMETMKACLDLPYDGDDPSLKGLNMGEAMNVQQARKAANGDSAAFNLIMDRLVGAPVQRSMNFTGDLSDFLDKVSDQTKEVVIDVTADVKDDMSDL